MPKDGRKKGRGGHGGANHNPGHAGDGVRAGGQGAGAAGRRAARGSISVARDGAPIDDFWTESPYDAFVGLAAVAGILLQNVVLFGKNIESWNWGLVTVLVALQCAWSANKLLAFADPALVHVEHGLRAQLILAARVLLVVAAGPVLASLWKFDWADVVTASSAAAVFVAIVLGVVLAARQRPSLANAGRGGDSGDGDDAAGVPASAVVAYGLPYALEFLLVCFSTGAAPRLFPGHPHVLVDEGNSWMCAAAVALNVATLLALQAVSRLRRAAARRQLLPWVLACQTAVLAAVCAWGLSGALAGQWARSAQLGTLSLSITVYARAYHDHTTVKATKQQPAGAGTASAEEAAGSGAVASSNRGGGGRGRRG